MAIYFQLLDKQSGTATAFNDIDIELCTHFNEPIDDNKYLAGWYDSIGYRAASGDNWQDIIEYFEQPIADGEEWAIGLLDIAMYLSEKYTINNWSGR